MTPPLSALFLAVVVVSSPSPAGSVTPAAQELQAVANYGRLPLAFEANRGQAADEVQFQARGKAYAAFLTHAGLTLVLPRGAAPVPRGVRAETGVRSDDHLEVSPQPVALRMSFVGSSPRGRLSGLDELPGRSNYLRASASEAWITGVPSYARVSQASLYPGIDLVYHSHEDVLEYDLTVAPGANWHRISLRIDGADRLLLETTGDLALWVSGQKVLLRAPVAYQEQGGSRRTVDSRYVLHAGRRVAFEVGPYDHDAPLVIDPTLDYATYLGGAGLERLFGIAIDASGSAYVTGTTRSLNFPTASPLQGSKLGDVDCFVAKLNPSGTALVYSTYLGGTGSEDGPSGGIAVDAAGNAYVTGSTGSANFPVTAGALKTTLSGSSDAFLAKLNPSGSGLAYSTYLGGNSVDDGFDLAIDGSGNAYISGQTYSPDFPTRNPYQPALSFGPDAFVTKLNTTGSGLVYSTYLGGSSFDWGLGIAIDAAGSAYVTGQTASPNFPTSAGAIQPAYAGGADAFVFKLDASGSSRVYGTYLGGTLEDLASDIAVDAAGNAYITGATFSANFPTANAFDPSKAPDGREDAIVARLNSTGTGLVFSTYLGGPAGGVSQQGFTCFAQDFGTGIALGPLGRVFVSGVTSSCDFPTVDPVQPLNASNRTDAFLTVFTATGTGPVFSTYLGGLQDEHENFYNPAFVSGAVAVDAVGNAYMAGFTASTDFPVRNALQASSGGAPDAFVARILIDAATPTLVSLISAEVSRDHVLLRWDLGGNGSALVERLEGASPWRQVGEVLADGAGRGSFEDREVRAGGHYSYRLAWLVGGLEQWSAGVPVDVPGEGDLALEGSRPNPTAGGGLALHFSLADTGPARLEVFDLSGRPVLARDVTALGPGQHVIELGPGARLPAGVYLLRLTQGHQIRTARATVVQ